MCFVNCYGCLSLVVIVYLHVVLFTSLAVIAEDMLAKWLAVELAYFWFQFLFYQIEFILVACHNLNKARKEHYV